MSTTQNLIYSVVQVVHNLGAVAAVGGSLIALRLRENVTRKALALLVLVGWMTQGMSGATFGMISFYYYQQFPDIGRVASIALLIKMMCATLGFVSMALYLWRGEYWHEREKDRVWLLSATLALTAISAAAFLRWFS